MHRRWLLVPVLAALLFALGPISALAAPAHTRATSDFPKTDISGVEVFPGVPNSSGGVDGATFSGWIGGAGPVAGGWSACPFFTYCGSWIVVIDYEGPAGIGHTVKITGEKWALTLKNLHTYFGAITGGYVEWPASLSDDTYHCGAGVAQAYVTLLSFQPGGPKSVYGCLDDTHLNKAFPPRIWGVVQ